MTAWEIIGMICVRIVVAAVLGAGIGLERGWRKRDAGIRTHTVAAIAAAAYMLLSIYAYGDSPFETDFSILATQILYGFSFMGAGMILKNKYQVVAGLRTAAGIWATVAVGMACGQGMLVEAVIATAVIVAVQVIFHYRKLDGRDWTVRKIKLTVADTARGRELVQTRVLGDDAHVLTSKCKRQDGALHVTVRVRTDREWSIGQVLDLCDRNEEILSISI